MESAYYLGKQRGAAQRSKKRMLCVPRSSFSPRRYNDTMNRRGAHEKSKKREANGCLCLGPKHSGEKQNKAQLIGRPALHRALFHLGPFAFHGMMLGQQQKRMMERTAWIRYLNNFLQTEREKVFFHSLR
jgi:hypothetical protein